MFERVPAYFGWYRKADLGSLISGWKSLLRATEFPVGHHRELGA